MNDDVVSVLISGGLAIGGAQTHVQHLCRELRLHRASVTVAATATNWDRSDLDLLRAQGVRLLLCPFGFGKWSWPSRVCSGILWSAKLRREFHVLYAIGYGRSHAFLRRFLRPAGQCVYHEIVDGPAEDHVVWPFVLGCDTVVANSAPVAARLAKRLPSKQLSTIPFLAGDADPPEHAAPRPPAGCRELRITYLGRTVPHKRIEPLVREWPVWSLLPGITPCRLDVFGSDSDPTLLCHLREFVLRSKIEDRVCLHGSYDRRQLDAILDSADLVVLPSLYEGLPLVLVEAMLRGVPIVACAAGGTEELAMGNPDVLVTAKDWASFVVGMREMAARVRNGLIDSRRLQRWTRERYGHSLVAESWRRLLLSTDAARV